MQNERDYTKRVSETERNVGERAKVHIYYRNKAGKLFFDAFWTDAQIAHVKRRYQVIRVVDLDQSVPVR